MFTPMKNRIEKPIIEFNSLSGSTPKSFFSLTEFKESLSFSQKN